MFKPPGRLIAFVAVVLALGVAATVAFLVLPPRQTSTVPVPEPSATPEQVVAAYLDALNAHDCDTVLAVMTSAARDTGELWCDDVAGLTDVAVSSHFMERPQDSGHTAPEEVANVPVTFDLNWRPFHNDGSMGEGPTTWGYQLVRGSKDSPWRIFGQGTG